LAVHNASTDAAPPRAGRRPTVNLILWDNGVGLTRDMHILRELWTAAGLEVTVTAKRRGTLRKWLQPLRLAARMRWQRLRGDDPQGRFDCNVMLEHLRAEYLSCARRNVLVPNPEWFGASDRAMLPHVDLVLAKTRYGQALFDALGCRTRYMSFTSADRRDRTVVRAPAFFHLAGRSEHKGTDALLQLWLRHPQWPRLTVVQHPRMAKQRLVADNIDHRVDYLSDAELRRLQNAHWFHLCPSQTEGFGHYIVEAMSVGAVTLTVDAPPMNELITADRGILVGCSGAGQQGLATKYAFDEQSMEQAIERARALDDAQCRRLGERARAWFEENDAAFRQLARGALLRPE
jgi:glycosyltransferase involved in cell wall biosynthesis